jgi:hypothetical protein
VNAFKFHELITVTLSKSVVGCYSHNINTRFTTASHSYLLDFSAFGWIECYRVVCARKKYFQWHSGDFTINFNSVVAVFLIFFSNPFSEDSYSALRVQKHTLRKWFLVKNGASQLSYFILIFYIFIPVISKQCIAARFIFQNARCSFFYFLFYH